MKLKSTAVLAAALVTLTAPLTYAAVFSDLHTTPWPAAQNYIVRAAQLGLMEGEIGPDGTYLCRPAEDVTLCETIQLVYALAEKDAAFQYDSTILSKWNDVLVEHSIPTWAAVAVSYCLEENIVTAEELKHFVSSEGVHVPATRQEAALYLGRFFSRYQPIKSDVSLPYGDESQISKKALPYVKLLYSARIMLGSEGQIRPNDPLTRAEMAVLVTKIYDAATPLMTKSASGYITSITDQGSTLLVTVDGGGNSTKKGFSLKKTMSAVYEGNQLPVTQLNVGDLISIKYQGAQVTDLQVANHNASGSQTAPSVQGYLKTITYDDITLDNDAVYPLDPNCLALIDGNDATMKDILDLMEDASVYVTVTLSDGDAIKIAAEKRSQNQYEGKIYSLTTDTLTLEDGRKQYPLSPSVTAVINGRTKELETLIHDVEEIGASRISCTILLDQSNRVTKITAEYEEDDELSTKSGELKTLESDSVTIGSNTYSYSDIEIRVTDGTEKLTSISQLNTALKNGKEIDVDLSYLSGTKEAVRLTGQVTGVKGELVHAWSDTQVVVVRLADGTLKQYDCKRDIEITLAGWKNMSLKDLDSYLSDEVDNGQPVNVTLDLSNNFVDSVNIKR